MIREANARLKPLAMLWSLGKYSTTMLWLTRKAFQGRVPFPVILLDTANEFAEVYALRDRYIREWNLDYIHAPYPPVKATDPGLPPNARAAARKTLRVKQLIAERCARSGQVGAILWLTGLSGAGKSTLAMAPERALFDRGWNAYTIDGDNVRRGLTADAGLVCVTAFISPFDDDRGRARAMAGHRLFLEVCVKSELETREARDPKGLYGKARRGEIKGFTGIDSPYEEPSTPDLVIDTQHAGESARIAQLVSFVIERCGA